MAREHSKIASEIPRLAELICALPPGGPFDEDLPDLRRTLYGLHAILRLHFA